MKTRFIKILPFFILVLASSLSSSGQMKMMKMLELPDILAKPAYEASDPGISLKVWIMSIINDRGNVQTAAQRYDDDIINTHNVLVQLKDDRGNTIPDEMVKLLMVSPSGKKQAIDLDPRSDQYGGSVAFLEKGEYQLTVSINVDGTASQKTFGYKVYR